MTGSSIQRLPFTTEQFEAWGRSTPEATNWPVVYTLDGGGEVYVGESLNMLNRARQHRANRDRGVLDEMRVIVDPTFNKSVCLDLESYLIRLFSGDGMMRVQNRNVGIVDADYYDRASYRERFRDIFEQLRHDDLFSKSIPEIENSDLFKLSPFKSLTQDQAFAVEAILDGLFEDLDAGRASTSVVQGSAGTGKTIVAIYLLKLLRDVQAAPPVEEVESDSLFADFFAQGYASSLEGRRIGFVVPQQSLRTSVQRVFSRTPGLDASMVVTPFQVGQDGGRWDLLVVDEAHRLSQRASQASGVQNRQFQDITVELFGVDDKTKTQLDWITAKSDHQILLLDRAQSIRPGDLPADVTRSVVDKAVADGRWYPLMTQMRVQAGKDYVAFVRAMLSDSLPRPEDFGDYDLRLFDDLGEMRRSLRAREEAYGLARLVAGYAWPWRSKKDTSAPDIELDGERLQWNRTAVDWISSPTSFDEVGSVHTVQGYDLNYAGVIIGPDLVFEVTTGRVRFQRDRYFDKRGMRNNNILGITYSDDDLLELVRNIYVVLLTRGIRGTYVYIVDPALRERVRSVIRASARR